MKRALPFLALLVLPACATTGPLRADDCGPDPQYEQMSSGERLNAVRTAAGEAMQALDHTGRIIHRHSATEIILHVHANGRELREEDIEELRQAVTCALPVEGLDVVIDVLDLPAIEG